jgi:hypothetical protein
MTHCGYLNSIKKITVDVYILDMGYVSFVYLHITKTYFIIYIFHAVLSVPFYPI